MTSRDFCYWLQGFFEITGEDAQPLTPKQARMIRAHLELVFKHEISPPAKTAVDLQKLHQAATGRLDYAVC